MFCQKCGANVAEGTSFCPACGNAMGAPVAPAENFNAATENQNNNDFDATVAVPFVNGAYQPQQAPVAPPPFMPVAPQPPQKKNTGLKAAIVVVSVIAVAAIVMVILLATGIIGGDKKDSEDATDNEGTTVSQTADDEDSDIIIGGTDDIKDKYNKDEEKTTIPSNKDNDANSKKINRGMISGNTYTADYLDLSFTKPEAWQFVSDSELAQLGEMDESVMNSDVAEYLENNLIFYEMMARTTAGNKNVIIAYESLTATDSEDATVEEYFDGVKLGMDATGLGYQYSEVKKEKLGNETFHSMLASMNYSGFSVYQKLFVVMKDKVAATIVITATSEAEIAEIEAMFSK